MSGLTGGCLCGTVRYRTLAPERVTYYCHCTDCRRASGSAFHIGVVVREEELEILSGSVKGYNVEADSGNALVRDFCPDCGSQLFMRSPAQKGLMAVNAGTLDNPNSVTPTASLWTEAKIDWAEMGENIECFAKGGLWARYL